MKKTYLKIEFTMFYLEEYWEYHRFQFIHRAFSVYQNVKYLKAKFALSTMEKFVAFVDQVLLECFLIVLVNVSISKIINACHKIFNYLDSKCIIVCIISATYTFTLTIGLYKIGSDRFEYDSKLNITNPNLLKRYTEMVKEALDRMFMQSDLRDHYRSISIGRFLPSPTRIEFNVQLTENTNESTLIDVIRKYLILNNFSLGGTEVIALKNLGMVSV